MEHPSYKHYVTDMIKAGMHVIVNKEHLLGRKKFHLLSLSVSLRVGPLANQHGAKRYRNYVSIIIRQRLNAIQFTKVFFH